MDHTRAFLLLQVLSIGIAMVTTELYSDDDLDADELVKKDVLEGELAK